jgi:uncharacterized Ntn-hydrolase superfamily protein
MTYSIVARDPLTGEVGVAVQTCMPAVGSVVPWARAGVGAVATQAMTEIAHGYRCLDAMAAGSSAGDALAASLARDPGEAMRQVGAVDAHGRATAHTGTLCIDHAGAQAGPGFSVQANMMASENVWPAMADAYEGAAGTLAERMLAALDAGQAAGGDARGSMSAALLVVASEPADDPRAGVILDMRVDDHETPLAELRRLLTIRTAYKHYWQATNGIFAGDVDIAQNEIEAACALLPADENFRFLQAGVFAFAGRVDDARALTRALVSQRPGWATIIRSFAARGLFALPEGLDIESFIRA